jgi:hypothetical protein
MVSNLEMEGAQMSSAAVSFRTAFPCATRDESNAPSTRAYRTKTSFVAVHFYETGKGRIVFIPFGATLRAIGPSSLLPDGFEVQFERLIYHVFETDLVARSVLISESTRAKGRTMAVCA